METLQIIIWIAAMVAVTVMAWAWHGEKRDREELESEKRLLTAENKRLKEYTKECIKEYTNAANAEYPPGVYCDKCSEALSCTSGYGPPITYCKHNIPCKHFSISGDRIELDPATLTDQLTEGICEGLRKMKKGREGTADEQNL